MSSSNRWRASWRAFSGCEGGTRVDRLTPQLFVVSGSWREPSKHFHRCSAIRAGFGSNVFAPRGQAGAHFWLHMPWPSSKLKSWFEGRAWVAADRRRTRNRAIFRSWWVAVARHSSWQSAPGWEGWPGPVLCAVQGVDVKLDVQGVSFVSEVRRSCRPGNHWPPWVVGRSTEFGSWCRAVCCLSPPVFSVRRRRSW